MVIEAISKPALAKPHSSALRKGRVSEIGRAYLVTAATEGRRRLFEDWQLGRLMVREMKALHDAGNVETLAWVLMPDHLHWLFVLKSSELPTLMQKFKSRSARALNSARGTTGRIWQPGYHDHALRADEDLGNIARYIIANPLRAGLVSHIGSYPLWDAIWL